MQVFYQGNCLYVAVFGQQNLSQHLLQLFLSLEGVFGSIAAWIILDQYLNEFKVFGVIIILSAVIFSQLAPMYGKRKYG